MKFSNRVAAILWRHRSIIAQFLRPSTNFWFWLLPYSTEYHWKIVCQRNCRQAKTPQLQKRHWLRHSAITLKVCNHQVRGMRWISVLFPNYLRDIVHWLRCSYPFGNLETYCFDSLQPLHDWEESMHRRSRSAGIYKVLNTSADLKPVLARSAEMQPNDLYLTVCLVGKFSLPNNNMKIMVSTYCIAYPHRPRFGTKRQDRLYPSCANPICGRSANSPEHKGASNYR